MPGTLEKLLNLGSQKAGCGGKAVGGKAKTVKPKKGGDRFRHRSGGNVDLPINELTPPMPQQMPQQMVPSMPQQMVPPMPQQMVPPMPQQMVPPMPQQMVPSMPPTTGGKRAKKVIKKEAKKGTKKGAKKGGDGEIQLNGENESPEVKLEEQSPPLEQEGGKKKKEKKPRKLTAYNIFMKKEMLAMKKQEPNAKVTELMKVIAQKWRNQK